MPAGTEGGKEKSPGRVVRRGERGEGGGKREGEGGRGVGELGEEGVAGFLDWRRARVGTWVEELLMRVEEVWPILAGRCDYLVRWRCWCGYW